MINMPLPADQNTINEELNTQGHSSDLSNTLDGPWEELHKVTY